MSAANRAKLYYMAESPPCRTIMLVARMLNIDLDYHLINLAEKEHLSNPEFLSKNPFHCVPTLVEPDGFALWESRVIAAYLVETRAPESSLYPLKDVRKRATIDKLLHYDLGTFYRALGDIVYPLFRGGKLAMDKLPRFEEVLTALDQLLNVPNKPAFLAGGQEITLADVSLYFSFSLTVLVPEIDLAKFQNVSAWLALVEKTVAKWNDDDWMGKATENIKMHGNMLKEIANKNA